MRTLSTSRHALRLAIASTVATLGVVALAASPAQAQQPIARVVVEATPRPNLARAEQLETQGALDELSPRRWRDAAVSYRRAAELRGSTLDAARLYQRSAWLYSAAGDHGKGRQQLERSARIALDRGDVVRAANTLYDAALMAATDRDVRGTDATLQRLAVLLDAPLMPDDVRSAFQQKMSEPARVARR